MNNEQLERERNQNGVPTGVNNMKVFEYNFKKGAGPFDFKVTANAS